MPKAPRAKEENTTPKKRSRKATPAAGNGTQVAQPVTTSPAHTVAVSPEPAPTKPLMEQPHLEEKIRRRAYELYLERRGQGGSPEQDWLQAAAEIRSQFVA